MKKPVMIEINADRLTEIIDQMSVMADQINSSKASIVRITLLLHDLIGVTPRDVPHGT